jgi:transposase
VYRKILALLAVEDGTPTAEIARVLRVNRMSIYHWLRIYRRARDPAVLLDRYHGSRPTDWLDEIVTAVHEALAKSPDAWGYKAVNWTSVMLRKHIEETRGLKVSDRTIRRVLHGNNYVWKRPRHALQNDKSPRVMRRLRAIRKRVQSLPKDCVLLFEDETDLLLFPPLRAGWFLRGKPAKVPISGENAKRTIFGTIDVKTGRRIFISREGVCGCDFQALARKVREEYGDSFAHFSLPDSELLAPAMRM